MEGSSEQRVGQNSESHLNQLAAGALAACMRGEADELEPVLLERLIANPDLIGAALQADGVEFGTPVANTWFQRVTRAAKETAAAHQNGLGHGRPDKAPRTEPPRHRA